MSDEEIKTCLCSECNDDACDCTLAEAEEGSEFCTDCTLDGCAGGIEDSE